MAQSTRCPVFILLSSSSPQLDSALGFFFFFCKKLSGCQSWAVCQQKLAGLERKALPILTDPSLRLLKLDTISPENAQTSPPVSEYRSNMRSVCAFTHVCVRLGKGWKASENVGQIRENEARKIGKILRKYKKLMPEINYPRQKCRNFWHFAVFVKTSTDTLSK